MVLFTIKSFFPIRGLLKTLPFSGTNNYIKILGGSILEKQQSTSSAEWKKMK